MKNALLSFLLLACLKLGWGQAKAPVENVLISFEKKKTAVSTSEKGALQVNISPKDLHKFKNRGWVRYSDVGAREMGKPMI